MKTKKIKDNIHGYIYFSLFEKSYLSHPLVLRMHHVRQNGAAFLTYPSIRVHRYEHSIGAMHLAGELFLRSFHFSNDPHIGKTLTSVCKRICGEKFEEVFSKRSIILQDDPLYKLHRLEFSNEDQLATVLMFQAVRLAMLVHDIGHPPFSHTTEVALKQMDLSYPDHERIGLSLLSIINKDISGNQDFVPRYIFIEAIFRLVSAIVNKQHTGHNYLSGIATIVSSDLDADRLDYVKRDALAGGLATNSYDVGRLYDALKLVSQKVSDDETEQGIGIIYTSDAMSTLEAFFGMRFHMYRWMLFHHSVILHNMTLMSIVHDMDTLANSRHAGIKGKVEEFFAIATKTERFADYWYFTDAYMMEVMAYILNEFQKDKKLTEEYPRVFRSLKTFLHRSKEFLTPFWKAPADYADFSDEVAKVSGTAAKVTEAPRESPKLQHSANVQSLNSSLRLKYQSVVEQVRKENSGKSRHLDNVDYYAFRFAKLIEQSINAEIQNSGFIVRAYYLAKFKAIPKGMLLQSKEHSYPLEVLSPTIAGLEEAWNALPHLWLFLEREGVESGDGLEARVAELAKKRKEVIPKVAQAISHLIGGSA